jgi:hypothetical protein
MITGQESVFEVIVELKDDIGTMNSKIGVIQTDIKWIKKMMNEMNDRQTNCTACINADYLYNQANANKDDIKKINADRNTIIGISVAFSGLVGFFVSLVAAGIIKIV